METNTFIGKTVHEQLHFLFLVVLGNEAQTVAAAAQQAEIVLTHTQRCMQCHKVYIYTHSYTSTSIKTQIDTQNAGEQTT